MTQEQNPISGFAANCDRILETGWLLAAMAAPLFFDICSVRVFEPDKIALLRSIALVMAGAWLCKTTEAGFQIFRSSEDSLFTRMRRVNALTLPIACYVAIASIATIASVAPGVSWSGSYPRLQGFYTNLSYLVIFAAMLHALKTRAQLDRLITVMILVSLPVSAYAWLQHFRIDPLSWGLDLTQRVASSMGNPIFVGAYLIMLLPLTLARWWMALRCSLRKPGLVSIGNANEASVNRSSAESHSYGSKQQRLAANADWCKGAASTRNSMAPNRVKLVCYTIIIVFQLLALLWSGSRGPWVGLFAAWFVVLIGVAVRCRITWLWGGTLVIAVVGIGFLWLLNGPNSPFERIKLAVPSVAKMATIFGGPDTNKVRLLIWEGAIEASLPHAPLGFEEHKDLWNPFRTLTGHGPESQSMVFPKFYTPELAHYEGYNAAPDRSHNEILDSLVTIGILGLLAVLGLFACVLHIGFKCSGLLDENSNTTLFATTWLACGLIGIAVAFAVTREEARYLGVALPAVLIAITTAYLVKQAAYFKTQPTASPWTEEQILAIALVGAVVAHFVEIQFGIAISVTRTYFWIDAALIVLLGLGLKQRMSKTLQAPVDSIETSGASRRVKLHDSRATDRVRESSSIAESGPRRKNQTLNGAIVRSHASTPEAKSGLRLALVYGLLLGVMMVILVFDFIGPSFGKSANTFWIYAIIGFTMLFACVFLATQVQTESDDAASVSWSMHFLILLAIAFFVMTFYWVLHEPRLTHPATSSMLDHIWRVANTTILFFVSVFVLLLLIARVLIAEHRPAKRWFRKPYLAILYIVIAGVVGIAIVKTNVDCIRADIFYRQANNLDKEKQYDDAILMLKQAIELQSNQETYRLHLGTTYLKKAKQDSDPIRRDQTLKLALAEFLEARRLNPLHPDHTLNLARFYSTWGEITNESAKRSELLEQSIAYFEQVLMLSPNSAQIHNDFATAWLLSGQADRALVRLDESLKIDPVFARTYFLRGNVFLKKEELSKKEEDLDEAIKAYGQALQYDPKLIEARLALGLIYSRLNRIDDAIAENLAVSNQAPNEVASWRNLAILHRQKADFTRALEYAQRALALSGNKQDKVALDYFIEQIKLEIVRQNAGGSP